MEEKIVDSQYQTKGYLSYLGILVLIPLLTIKKEDRDEFIDCHIKQGVGLFITSVIGSILRSFNGIGIIGNLIAVLAVVLMIIGLINVSKKKITAVPLIGQFFTKLSV